MFRSLVPFRRSRSSDTRRPPRRQSARLQVEPLEDRLLLNNRFVVPAGIGPDNQTTFATLQAALTTAGLNAGDTIQIEPNSSPGNIVNANLPQLARLTIQGDPSAGLAATPEFYLTDAVTLSSAQTGFTLRSVNIGLTDAGSLTFNTNGSLLGVNLINIDSSALHALTFAGTPDTLSNSTVTGNVALPLGSSLLLVNPGAGSANTITANIFLANAPIDALVTYQASTAVTVADQVANNTFLANPGSIPTNLLWVGVPVNAVTPSGQISGLTIRGNSFTGSDTDVTAINLDQTGGTTSVSNNQINLTASSILDRGIVVTGTTGTTTSAFISVNQINTHGFGTGLEINLGPDATSVIDLRVQGNDFHTNRIGVLVQTLNGGTSTALLTGIDLGGGNQTSLGGNDFRSFNAAATVNSGALVLSNLAATQGTLHAQRNLFAGTVSVASVITDPNKNTDTTNNLTGNAAFVQALYVEFLGRVGDTTNPMDAGVWINALSTGTQPGSVATAIARSPESYSTLVEGLYVKLLGRNSDPGGKAQFVTALENGATFEQILVPFVVSPEYAGLAGSDAAYVQSLYDKLLGRVAGSGEVAGWVNALPTLGRGSVATQFLESPEFRGDVVRVLYGPVQPGVGTLISLFSNLLHRAGVPAQSEINGWVNSGLDLLTIEITFAGTPEFQSGGSQQQVIAPAGAPELHRHQTIIPRLANVTPLAVSTALMNQTDPATNNNQNPYGLAIVPPGFPTGGVLQPGDALVADFNDTNNVAGQGVDVLRITPAGQASLFYKSPLQGVDYTVGILKAGFVVVGNIPADPAGARGLQILDKNGNLVTTITDPTLLTNPWVLTVANDTGTTAQLFVSNPQQNVPVAPVTTNPPAQPLGTVTRLDLQIQGNTVTVVNKVQIASGYLSRPDAAAFVVGPAGVNYDARTDTLYVSSEDETFNGVEQGAIFAIAHASVTPNDHGKGTLIFQDATHLHGPLGVQLLPNGDLAIENADSVNTDPNQPSELVEITKTGQFVGQFSIDPANGGSFSLKITNVGGVVNVFAVDDNANPPRNPTAALLVWTFQSGNPLPPAFQDVDTAQNF